MLIFKVDYIHPQKTLAWASDLSNISANLLALPVINENIAAKKAVNSGRPFTLIGIAGRWLVLYSANGVDEDDTMLYFVDFRIELDDSAVSHVLSANAITNLKSLQTQCDPVYTDKMNTYEVSYANEQEKILKPNLVSCEDDNIVLAKAKALGALHILKTAESKNQFQVSLVDEMIDEGDYKTKNIYALVHFNATATEPGGFLYIKLYDIANNLDLLDDFTKALKQFGGKFDRAFLMEKFMPERWN